MWVGRYRTEVELISSLGIAAWHCNNAISNAEQRNTFECTYFQCSEHTQPWRRPMCQTWYEILFGRCFCNATYMKCKHSFLDRCLLIESVTWMITQMRYGTRVVNTEAYIGACPHSLIAISPSWPWYWRRCAIHATSIHRQWRQGMLIYLAAEAGLIGLRGRSKWSIVFENREVHLCEDNNVFAGLQTTCYKHRTRSG